MTMLNLFILENMHQIPVRIPIHDFKRSITFKIDNGSLSYHPPKYLWKCDNLLEFQYLV